MSNPNDYTCQHGWVMPYGKRIPSHLQCPNCRAMGILIANIMLAGKDYFVPSGLFEFPTSANTKPARRVIRSPYSVEGAFAFFFKHAGASWCPATEGQIAGTVRGALYLARIEFLGWDAGYRAEWIPDPEERGSWICTIYDQRHVAVASLCWIDSGRGGEPWGAPYARVVEAKLMDEALS